MRFLAFGFMIGLLFCRQVLAEEPQPIELAIHPRAIESPALKYQLFPAEMDRRPGNAAPILLRLPWEHQAWMQTVFPKLHEWNERPLTAPEWQSWKGDLPETFYQEMKRAAYRRDAYWEYPINETNAPYSILLPDVQGLRTFLGAGLSAKIRFHLTRGELDQAREGILVGFANSKHLAQTPFYINQLVAIAIHQIMLNRVTELIAQPQCPNFYWALSTLPDSMIELDRAASFEGGIFATTLPAVHDLDRPRDVKEWRKMATQLIKLLEESMEIRPQPAANAERSILAQIMEKLNPADQNQLNVFLKEARAELPGLLKISAEKVAAMSDEEACIRWYVIKRLARDQAMAAVMVLPPSEALRPLKTLQIDVDNMKTKLGAPKYDFLNPTAVYLTAWSLKRRIQLLRVVEAVRHYAGTHEGKLPDSLDAIEDLSIPRDIFTGEPFEWKLQGKTAILKAPALPATSLAPNCVNNRDFQLEIHLQMK